MRAVVRRVQLAAELRGPAPLVAGGGNSAAARSAIDDVGFRPEIRNGQTVAGQAANLIGCEAHRKPRRVRRRVLARRFERGRIALAEPARDDAGRRPGGGGQEQKPDAAVDGKDAALVVDPTRASTSHEENRRRRSAALP